MSGAARYLHTEVTKPIDARRRNPRPAIIPPFSFAGELEVGVSGFWYPTYTMELTRVSVSASGPGVDTAQLILLKQEPKIPDPILIKSIPLGASEVKAAWDIDNVLITPYDKIYIASFSESQHNGVVIQLVGNLMN